MDDQNGIPKAKASRKVKKAKVTRLVNQIRQHINDGINIHSLKKLRSELKEAIEMMEMSNEVLYLLEPENDEHDQWLETALQPTISCLPDIEGYIQQHCESSSTSSRSQRSFSNRMYYTSSESSTYSKAQSSKSSASHAKSSVSKEKVHSRYLHSSKLIEHDIEVTSKNNEEDRKMMLEQEIKEKQLRETQAKADQKAFELRKLNEESMRSRKVRTLEESKQRAILEAELLQRMEQHDATLHDQVSLTSTTTSNEQSTTCTPAKEVHSSPESYPPTPKTHIVSTLSQATLQNHTQKTDAPLAKETYTTSVQVNSTETTQGGLRSNPLSMDAPLAKETYTTSVQVNSRETTQGGLQHQVPSTSVDKNSSTPLVTSLCSPLFFTPSTVPASTGSLLSSKDHTLTRDAPWAKETSGLNSSTPLVSSTPYV
ncbi:hypothetical protein AC249_AIPGENE6345 [Exaiptasia diaphana]|nr:hypothetical protein AC249_AIPGENE6345 [Exaiptasia diaphana]